MFSSFQILGFIRSELRGYGLVAAIFGLFTLAACGQKGPLFMAPQTVPLRIFPAGGAVSPPAVPSAAAPLTPASGSTGVVR